MIIPFYKHDISALEIKRVVQVLKSNWINTGPEVEKFREELKDFLKSPEVVLVSSAWAGLFLTLKAWGIKTGDEVITTPYTFSATANAIVQNGAKVVFADVNENYLIEPEEIAKKITSKTKAIVTMDYGGYPCDYSKIHQIVEQKKNKFHSSNDIQARLGRLLILADGAHSFGTLPKKKQKKLLPDISAYSFHTVKNLTTIDGGAITFFNNKLAKRKSFLNTLKALSLHGMNFDAFERKKKKSIFYDISEAGFKTNLTDVAAAIGRMQLKRMSEFYTKKKKLLNYYNKFFSHHTSFKNKNNLVNDNYHIFPHLYTLEGLTKDFNSLTSKKNFITTMSKKGIGFNMHYLPLPLTSFYSKLGFHLKDYPQTARLAKCHISLPFYTKLSLKKAGIVAKALI